METEAKKKLYSPNSAARTLDVSRSKIYELMKSGRMPFVMIDNHRRIHVDVIDKIAAVGTSWEGA